MNDLDSRFNSVVRAKPLMSSGTIVQFRNAAAGLVLRDIDDAFSAAGIPMGAEEPERFQGQRRTRFMAYVTRLDTSDGEDVSKLLVAFAHLMTTIQTQHRDPSWPDPLQPLLVNLRRDGFEWDGTRIFPSAGALISGAANITRDLDLKGLHQRIHAVEAKVDGDPSGAIGDAKEFLESVFRTVAKANGIEIGKDADVTEMFKSIRDVLDVVPPSVTDADKAEKIMQRLLGSLSGLAGQLTELRNAFGSGHGKDNDFVGLERKHARLAVTSAGALAAFVLESGMPKKS